MLARREALLGAGFMDERFFLFSDEPDLCLRIRRAGWRIVHSPAMTIVHHAGKAGVKPRLVAQEALARRLYAEKHFAAPHRAALLAARSRAATGCARRGRRDRRRRAAARPSGGALRALVGRPEPPFGHRRPPRSTRRPLASSPR